MKERVSYDSLSLSNSRPRSCIRMRNSCVSSKEFTVLHSFVIGDPARNRAGQGWGLSEKQKSENRTTAQH